MAIELTQEIGSRITTITEDTRDSGRQHSFSNAFPWLCKEEMRFPSTTPWSSSSSSSFIGGCQTQPTLVTE